MVKLSSTMSPAQIVLALKNAIGDEDLLAKTIVLVLALPPHIVLLFGHKKDVPSSSEIIAGPTDYLPRLMEVLGAVPHTLLFLCESAVTGLQATHYDKTSYYAVGLEEVIVPETVSDTVATPTGDVAVEAVSA